MESIPHLLLQEVERRIFKESVPRLTQCVSLLSEQALWERPNSHTNSVGNLVLHLCGNVNQWINSGLGGYPDNRERHKEFDPYSSLPAKELLMVLDVTISKAKKVIGAMDEASIQRTYEVQGFEESGMGILIHVTEHFSYHVGQISYAVKMLNDVDLGYYDRQDLDSTNG